MGGVIIALLFLLLIFSGGHPLDVDKKKKAAELSTASIHLAQAEYNSNNGVYYYTSGGCNSNSTQQINTNLFDGNATFLSEKTQSAIFDKISCETFISECFTRKYRYFVGSET